MLFDSVVRSSGHGNEGSGAPKTFIASRRFDVLLLIWRVLVAPKKKACARSGTPKTFIAERHFDVLRFVCNCVFVWPWK